MNRFILAGAFMGLIHLPTAMASSVQGIVMTLDGNSLSGVTVRITAPSLAEPIEIVNSTDGTYAVNLPPGTYELAAELSGFQTSRGNISVADEQVSTYDFALSSAAPSEAFVGFTQPSTNEPTTFTGEGMKPQVSPGGPDLRDLIRRFFGNRSNRRNSSPNGESRPPQPPELSGSHQLSPQEKAFQELQRQMTDPDIKLTAAQRAYVEQHINRPDVGDNVADAFRENGIGLQPDVEMQVRIAYLATEKHLLTLHVASERDVKRVARPALQEYVAGIGTNRHSALETIILRLLKRASNAIPIDFSLPPIGRIIVLPSPPLLAISKVIVDAMHYCHACDAELPLDNVYADKVGLHRVTIEGPQHHCEYSVEFTESEPKTVLCPRLQTAIIKKQ